MTHLDATPLTVGTQSEKFLFYRGVANFDVPLTTVILPNESIRVTNLGAPSLPLVVAFTNRDGKIGYRIERNVARTVTIPALTLDATLAGLRRDLEASLVSEGLFAKEAAAMVETWRDTWFENGTRVCRMVVITPAMQRDVDRADRVLADAPYGQAWVRIQQTLNAVLAEQVRRGTICP